MQPKWPDRTNIRRNRLLATIDQCKNKVFIIDRSGLYALFRSLTDSKTRNHKLFGQGNLERQYSLFPQTSSTEKNRLDGMERISLIYNKTLFLHWSIVAKKSVSVEYLSRRIIWVAQPDDISIGSSISFMEWRWDIVWVKTPAAS